MSENNINWLNVGIGAFIILAIVLLLVLILPFGNLVAQQDEIAVITINGAVTYDSSNSTKIFTSASQIENALNEANSNPNVKAIVLDINSKGGSQVACEEIADNIKKSSKPVVAYIGDKGLDESYLIASSADAILASPSSSVGGIGLSFIDSNKYSKTKLTGVYNEDYLKLKKSNEINPDNLLNGQKMIDQDYTQFIKAIAENRDLKPNYLAKLAHGKRYNGNEAKNLGLIDKIGNKNKAIELAASKANATNYTAVNYPKSHKSLTETLSENKIFNL
ncbi:MAG: S49 family peptidase [Methanobrevibacter sp.]|uniref:S49 family peptidase n=1 Tax=Methanobrevibacter sp. TaxID=66852 RepID=UPI0025E5A50F|nr:S49 family peptidase [Methanobrevibacter sp.]MBQ6139373.1 S49 family peptidase [Methanobrevibacter sp.]